MELLIGAGVTPAADVPAPRALASMQDYLDRLDLAPARRAFLQARIAAVASAHDGRAANALVDAMTALHGALAADQALPANPAFGSVGARLDGLRDDPDAAHLAPLPVDADAVGRARVATAPAVHRTPMVAHPWEALNPLRRWFGKGAAAARAARLTSAERAPPEAPASSDSLGGWRRAGTRRRLLLLALMLGQTGIATWIMHGVMAHQGAPWLEGVALALFAVLFCWISAGFWTAMAGFAVLLRGGDRYMISRHSVPAGASLDASLDAQARTAIIMPICNEDVTRVFAGLRATFESVAGVAALAHFDFYVLSDSNDPDLCVAEVDAWVDLCRQVHGFGKIFYRWRQRRVKRKSGNIDDFCRRWGRDYRYMVVLDADSVMSGACLTTLVRLMEANPGAGIIQTAPRASGRETLYARIQQFSSRVYGPLFTAGLHYWQLGESHYWGHNAIIRIAPFVRHCALAPLPGTGSLAGDILSHDFVEAALMRRAGWRVWIAYDLTGSHEEMPPNLLDELKRDRRWCHGNLMNFRLILARGMHPVHRVVFMTGVMAYLSAPLWFLLLVVSTVLMGMQSLSEPQYFFAPRQLFPVWPEWHPERALALFSATATLLFLPKFLSVLLVARDGAARYGGVGRLLAGMLLESVFSALLAPVRMLFHTRFVVGAWLGIAMGWKSPPREDAETTWGEALRKHGWHTVLGLAWGAGVYVIDPSYLWWLLPIVGAMALSIPLSVLSSRVAPGRWARARGLFVIPEEVDVPAELRATSAHAVAARRPRGFIDAVVDPQLNALICACGIARPDLPESARDAHARLRDKACIHGPDALTGNQKLVLLSDPLALARLHFDVWSAAAADPRWHQAIAHLSSGNAAS